MKTLVETVALPGLMLELERPDDPASLISDDAFGDDEFLPYWAELWPSGLALASYVAAQGLDSWRVLELGCGLGLPSLAAAAGGARVLATDWAPDAVTLLGRNAARNRLQLDVRRVDWREAGSLETRQFDVVLAADVLYEERNAAPLRVVVDELLAGGGEAWIADPGRHHAATFLAAGSARAKVELIEHSAIPSGGIYVFKSDPMLRPLRLSSSE
jgi:predicted nicotinamide N-methyase